MSTTESSQAQDEQDQQGEEQNQVRTELNPGIVEEEESNSDSDEYNSDTSIDPSMALLAQLVGAEEMEMDQFGDPIYEDSDSDLLYHLDEMEDYDDDDDYLLVDDEDEEEEDDDDDEGAAYSYQYPETRLLRGNPADHYDMVQDSIPAGLRVRLGGDFGKHPRQPFHTDMIYASLPPPSTSLSNSTATVTSPRTPRRRDRQLRQSSAARDVIPTDDLRRTSYSAFAPSRNLSSRIVDRRVGSSLSKEDYGAYVPNSDGVEVVKYGSAVYCGRYSEDSSFFYTCTKDYRVQMYDVRSAPYRTVEGYDFSSGMDRREFRMRRAYGEESHQRTMLRLRRTIAGRMCSWTITDAHLDKGNQWMIYSSLTPYVHLVPTSDVNDTNPETGAVAAKTSPAADDQQVLLDLSGSGSNHSHHFGNGLFSIRFSGNSKEIVAGARGGDIYVYDIEARKRVLAVTGHEDDVNSVCFADVESSHLLLSGSDDGYVKVWDRRSLSNQKPAGVLRGHERGLTYVSPKGDGRYCISNGKESACKLWDLRNMYTGNERTLRYASADDSVMTYRGHAVCMTLIRCNFSPLATTGQQYIYSGSADGRIHIWSLDGRTVQILDRSRAAPLDSYRVGIEGVNNSSGDTAMHDPSEREPPLLPDQSSRKRFNVTVRDVSWHTSEPSMMSTSWEGRMGDGGSIAKHEWKGLGKNGLTQLEDWVEKMRAETYA